jgi:hypothetical protein
LFTVVFALLLAGACENASPPKDFTFEPDVDTAYITGYTGNSLTPRIPSKIDGRKVVRISYRAFQSKKLTRVTIPNSVTEIGHAAFSRNPLTSVTIGADVLLSSSSSFDNGFDEFYDSNGKKAETYTYSDGKWTYGQ